MIWLLSAFKPNVLISIQAWLQLKHTRHTLGASLSTDIPKCLIGCHRYLLLLTSHRLDPCEALNLGSVCSQQLHGNMGPCTVLWSLCYGPSAMVPVLWSQCYGPSTMVPLLWSQCYGPCTMVPVLWS